MSGVLEFWEGDYPVPTYETAASTLVSFHLRGGVFCFSVLQFPYITVIFSLETHCI